MNRPWILLALAVGCTPGSATVTGTGSTTVPTTGTPAGLPTGGTTPTEPAEVLDASCTLDGTNPLRAWCTATLAETSRQTVTFSAPGAPSHTYTSETAGTEIEIFVWGLKPGRTYTWEIGDVSGTLQSGALPAAFSTLQVQQTGAFEGFDAVLVPLNCATGGFVMVDAEGEVVWYEASGIYTNQMDGYEWSQQDRSVLVVSNSRMTEIHVDGTIPLDLSGNYDGRGHHDVERWNGYTYVLHDWQVDGYRVDGVHVFDGETLVDTFRMEDHFTIGQPPSGSFPMDWSHSNAITIDDRGVMVLSTLNWSSVVAIDADPSSASFLEILWTAAGSRDTLPGNTYQADFANGDGFYHQHHPTLVNEDTLYLFDNTGSSGQSRASRYHLGGDRMALEESWSFPNQCPVQGGAVPLPDGKVLATCPVGRQVRQFEPGNRDPIYEATISCNRLGDPINRAIPVWIE